MIGRALIIAALLAGLGPLGPANAGDAAFRLSREDGSGWIMPGGHGGPAAFLFWHAECPPCLVELARLPEMQAAFPQLRFVTVSLNLHGEAKRALAKIALPARVEQARAPRDPLGLLRQLDNAKGVLPFAVLFDAAGRQCASHKGGLDPAALKRLLANCRRARSK